jgi:flagellar biogenesis protein FliO
MNRFLSTALVTSVMAMALSVTPAAHADEPYVAPTVAAAHATPPAITPIPSPVLPTVASPTPARVTPVPVPVPGAAAPTAPTTAAQPAAAATAATAPPPAAAQPAAAAAAPAAPPPPELPLALRPAPKPLTLAAEPAPTPWPYKLLFGAAVLGAGALAWKKRRSLAFAGKRATATTPVRILGKTSMGLRGELALVEVGGMRVLIGVTPSSMQTLAVLPDDDSEAAEEAAAAAMDEPEPERAAPRESRAVPSRRAVEKERTDLASRARALFSSLDVGPPIPSRVAASGFAASRYADERDSDAAPESAPQPPARAREAERERDRDRDRDRDREQGRRRRPSPRDASRDPVLEGQARGIALALGNRK